MIKGVGRSKEGFSLFGLFDRTKSLPGRQCLRDWMLKPFCDKERIIHRQDGVALVVRLSNRDFIGDVSKLLKKIHDIPRILLRIKKVEATHVEWCRLYSSLEAALPILDLITNFVGDSENRYVCHISIYVRILCFSFLRIFCIISTQKSLIQRRMRPIFHA